MKVNYLIVGFIWSSIGAWAMAKSGIGPLGGLGVVGFIVGYNLFREAGLTLPLKKGKNGKEPSSMIQ